MRQAKINITVIARIIAVYVLLVLRWVFLLPFALFYLLWSFFELLINGIDVFNVQAKAKNNELLKDR